MTIELRDVRFAYSGNSGRSDTSQRPVLDIHQWSVQAGEQVFIHGPSGGGKSTLLGLLSGMLVTSLGEVSVLGERLDQMSHRQRDRFRAQHIGYVFQQFNLIPYLNAVDNIKLARHFFKRNTKTLLHDEIKELLANLNIASEDWSKPTAKLSNGQQQRVAVARALINKPELIIADEPTSSLDQQNRDKFMSILMSQVKDNNMTLIFVSHDLSLSQYFTRVDALGDINRAGS